MSDESTMRRVIEGHTLYSAHLEEERTVKIYLPPRYSPERSYPVLYCHDGSEFFTHGRIATIANQQLAAGLIEPLLIVGIAVNKNMRTADYALDGARSAAYIRFVAEECLPFIEATYSTSTQPADRSMAGVSLGAVTTLELFLRYPHLLQRMLLFSGAYYPAVQERIANRTDLSALSAWMVAGTSEDAVDTTYGTYDFLEANRTMRTLLTDRNAAVTYGEAEGTHIWGFWQKHIPDALRWLFA